MPYLDLSKMSEDQIQDILSAGEASGKQAILDQQMKQAMAMRNAAEPQGRTAGKMYVAPSPFEVIGNTLMKYQGYKDQQALTEQQKKILEDQTRQRGLLFKLLQQQYGTDASGNPQTTPTSDASVGGEGIM